MKTNEERKKIIDESRKRTSTFDEEPTEFRQVDVEVPVTRLRKHDRFRHRNQGWVTVTDVDVRVKKVKITYSPDGMDVIRDTYSDMGIADVKVVRQYETDEHKLWRLERDLLDYLEKELRDKDGEVTNMNSSMAERLKTHGPFEMSLPNQYAVTFMERGFMMRLVGELDWLARWNRGRRANKLTGDAVTTTVRFFAEEVKTVLSDSGYRRSRSSEFEEEARRAEGIVLGREYHCPGTLRRMAQEALDLRDRLGIGPAYQTEGD